jgi:hypothetical protein
VLERDRGIFDGQPVDGLFRQPPPMPPITVVVQGATAEPPKPQLRDESKLPMSALIDRLLTEKKTLGSKTKGDYPRSANWYEQVIGKKPLAENTGTDILKYKDALLETPRNFHAVFKTDNLPEAVAKRKALISGAGQDKKTRKRLEKRYPTLDPGTINDKYLSNLRTFFDWAARNKFAASNVAAGVAVAVSKKGSAQIDLLRFAGVA